MLLRFLSTVFDPERTNQLNLLPDKDLVDLCHPIEPYQVTKNLYYLCQSHQKRYLSLKLNAGFDFWPLVAGFDAIPRDCEFPPDDEREHLDRRELT